MWRSGSARVASLYHAQYYHEVSYLSIKIWKRFRLNAMARGDWVAGQRCMKSRNDNWKRENGGATAFAVEAPPSDLACRSSWSPTPPQAWRKGSVVSGASGRSNYLH